MRKWVPQVSILRPGKARTGFLFSTKMGAPGLDFETWERTTQNSVSSLNEAQRSRKPALSGAERNLLFRREQGPSGPCSSQRFGGALAPELPKTGTAGIAPGRSDLQLSAGCCYLLFAAAGVAVDKTRVFSRAFSRLLYRETVFACSTPFCTLLSSSETVALYCAWAAFLSPLTRASRRARRLPRTRVRLARFTSVRVTV